MEKLIVEMLTIHHILVFIFWHATMCEMELS